MSVHGVVVTSGQCLYMVLWSLVGGPLQVMLETEQQETEEREKEEQEKKLAAREQRCERRIRRVLFGHDGQCHLLAVFVFTRAHLLSKFFQIKHIIYVYVMSVYFISVYIWPFCIPV